MTFTFYNIKRIRFNSKSGAIESEMLLRTMNEEEAQRFYDAVLRLLPEGEEVIIYTNIED